MSYSVDTSALTEAWVRSYPPDVFPSLWHHLEELVKKRRLLAVDEVLHELERKDDDLYQWCLAKKKKMFILLGRNQQIQRRAARIINQFASLINPSNPRGGADPFVIALAAEWELTVVTGERSKPSKPKIPDVCRELGIPCISLVELFKNEGWKV